ncbi:Do family serine endopeptidase [Thiothrix litoralis]|uniref:Probable periplasmic serine endoprotease DegP-like n=1 Tax=Thiothrix litoralis TaxID=2891210 RepID=A0ABX7WY39_9GAMM|nr:Do family serine endopeptidase [Thiothrix litoralis]QTR48226.1 Do family serine endopeptidase [Thiothrix litoralis]
MLMQWLRGVVLVCIALSAGAAFARDLPQFTELVKQNGPAVVNISTKQSISPREMLPDSLQSPETDELFDQLMKRFFERDGGGGGKPFDFDSSSRGSGFIYSQDGYIVTNHHVVYGADEIRVKLNDGRELPATLIGSDKRTDVAVLKVDATDLPVLKMGTSAPLEVGEWVLAIGSPFGFDHSATAGIVSAKGRSLPDENYVPFIQTDVAINPGNSGGPLFNLAGEVVGINSQIYSRSGGFMGVSFAIPIDVAQGVIEQLKSKGAVSRGWIGVYVQEIDANLAQSFKMSKPEGALVAQVMMDGPAARALNQGDVILRFDGNPVANAAALPPIVGNTPIGKKVAIEVLREGKRETVTMTVTELPKDPKDAKASDAKPFLTTPVVGTLGMKLSDTEAGVLVDEVIGEPARSAGIAIGDAITQLDGQAVTAVAELQSIAAELSVGKTVAVLVNRGGSARFLAMKIEANARE